MKRLDAIGRFLSVVSTAAVVSLVALVAPAAADQFSGVQSMAVARFSFTATTLLNGDVLVAGGARSTGEPSSTIPRAVASLQPAG
jgi:hypothetical protein